MAGYRSRAGLRLLLALAVTTEAAPRTEGQGPETARPVVAGVDFIGNERFGAVKLREGLATRIGRALDEDALVEDRERLLRIYREDGFLFADVEAVVSQRAPGRTDVRFLIREGHRARLDEVEVRGNTSFPAGRLIAVSGLEPARLLGLLSPGRYVPGSVSTGLENIRRFYRKRGFFDVLVELEDVRIDPRKKLLSIDVRVEEGERFRVAGVEVEGERVFPEPLLLDRIALPTGGFYSGEEVQRAYKRLLEWYQKHSDLVPKVRVRPIFGENDEVTVVFEIEEGGHVFVREVRIVGNWRSRDRVVRQYLEVIPGTPWVPLEAEESERRLRGTGFFEDVKIRELDTGDERLEDIEVAVTEKERVGWFEVGGGASTSRGAVGYVRVESRNFDLFRLPRSLTDWRGAFSGGGQLLSVDIIPGSRESEFRASFHEPYLYSSDTTLTASGWGQIFERESYDESRVRGEVEVRRFLDEEHRFSLGLAYRVENVLIDDLDPTAPPDVAAARGHTFLSYPRVSLSFRDLAFNRYSGPAGFATEARLDVAHSATGSDLDFTRLTARADVFLPFFDSHPDFRHTLHVGVEAGWIEGIGGDDVFLFERLYMGGPGSFRGFDYRRAGPHQMDTPVGGQALLRGTVEYSTPVFFPEVRAVALFDWGNLEADFGSFSTGRFRTAVGGGLQLRVPFPFTKQVVPVNLYWVQALSSETGDRERLFTFTLGFGF